MGAATIITSQDQCHGAILIRSVGHGYETYEWALSGSDLEIIVTATTASENVASDMKQA
jgi:hypothetical protein